jgi:hypothetical protein
VKQKEVSLSANYGLNVVTAVAAAAAHPGAAPPISVHSHQSVYPTAADPECMAPEEYGPTPSPVGSSSSSAR